MPNISIKDDDPDLKDCLSLRDYVLKLVREGKTNTPEFEALKSIYGVQHLRDLYAQAQKEEKEK